MSCRFHKHVDATHWPNLWDKVFIGVMVIAAAAFFVQSCDDSRAASSQVE